MILVASFLVFYVPISPVLTVSFQISPYQVAGQWHWIEVLDRSYSKVSLAASASMTKGITSLAVVSAQYGEYTLVITINYSGETLSSGSFGPLGNGKYMIQTAYWPRSEQAGIPYSISFAIFANGQQIDSALTTIVPG
jgi:hypothetical protein